MSEPRVVVVGSGAAGMAAAAAAATAGAHVTVLEAAEHLGGTTATSGGVVWMPATPWAKAAGVEDSLDAGLEYLRALELGDADRALTETYVREGIDALAAMEERTPLRWSFMALPDYHAELPGGSEPGRGLEIGLITVGQELLDRVRPDPYGAPPSTLLEGAAGEPGDAEIERRERLGMIARGRGIVAGFLSVVLDRGGEARTGVRAMRLLVEDGAVVGVEAEDGERFEGSVVLASGGFERNEELVRTFMRGPLLGPAGPPTNRGDGLVMGMELGARLANMSEAWWAPSMHVPGEELDGAPFYRILFTDCAQPGSVLVDGRGRRFTNEAANYSDLGRSFQAFDASTYGFPGARAWLVFDAARRAGRPLAGDSVWSLDPGQPDAAAGSGALPDGPDAAVPAGSASPPADDPDWLLRADTLDELAALIDVPATALRATVERFNAQAAAGRDLDYTRGEWAYDRFSMAGAPLRPLGDPPFYALRVLPGALGTRGGLRIDSDGRVLRGDGAITGLYAAGNAAASPFGMGYPGPGATIGPAIVFGWRAGEHAADYDVKS